MDVEDTGGRAGGEPAPDQHPGVNPGDHEPADPSVSSGARPADRKQRTPQPKAKAPLSDYKQWYNRNRPGKRERAAGETSRNVPMPPQLLAGKGKGGKKGTGGKPVAAQAAGKQGAHKGESKGGKSMTPPTSRASSNGAKGSLHKGGTQGKARDSKGELKGRIPPPPPPRKRASSVVPPQERPPTKEKASAQEEPTYSSEEEVAGATSRNLPMPPDLLLVKGKGGNKGTGGKPVKGQSAGQQGQMQGEDKGGKGKFPLVSRASVGGRPVGSCGSPNGRSKGDADGSWAISPPAPHLRKRVPSEAPLLESPPTKAKTSATAVTLPSLEEEVLLEEGGAQPHTPTSPASPGEPSQAYNSSQHEAKEEAAGVNQQSHEALPPVPVSSVVSKPSLPTLKVPRCMGKSGLPEVPYPDFTEARKYHT